MLVTFIEATLHMGFRAAGSLDLMSIIRLMGLLLSLIYGVLLIDGVHCCPDWPSSEGI